MSAAIQLMFSGGASNGSFIRDDSGTSAVAAVGITRTATLSTDFQIAFMGINNSSTNTWTGDTGWTEAIDQNAGVCLRVAYIANSGTSTSWTFTSTSADKGKAAIDLTFRGVSFDAIGSIATNSGATITTPSITVASSNSLLLFLCIVRPTVTVSSAPSGMSLISSGGGGGGGSAPPQWYAYMQRVSSGASGSRSITFDTGLTSAAVLCSLTIS